MTVPVLADSPSAADVADPVVAPVTADAPAPAAADAPNTDVTAASSDGNPEVKPDAKTEPTTLDIIRDVVKKPAAEAPKSSDEANAKPADVPANEAPEAKAKREKDEESRFDKHPGFQRVIKQRDEYKRAAEADAAAATEYRKLQTFQQGHGLTDSHVQELLTLGALIRTNPAEALKRMRVEVADLEALTGEALPDDLLAAVDEGEMTEERALELSKLRATAAAAKSEAETTKEETAAANAAAAAKASFAKLTDAIISWEDTAKGKDPHFAQKQPLIRDRVVAVVAQLKKEGKASFTEQEATEIVSQAYAYVNETTKAFATPKPAIRPPLNKGSAPAAAAKPAPGATTLEIAKRAIGR